MKRRRRRNCAPYSKLHAARLFKSATGGFVPLSQTLHGIVRTRTTSGQRSARCEAVSQSETEANAKPEGAWSAHTIWESRRLSAVYAAASGCSPQRNSERPSAASAHARMDCIPGVAADCICAEAARDVFGDFSSDKTKLTEMMTKVTAGIVPGMKPEEIREKFWENFSNLSDAEKAFSGSMSSMSDDQKKRTITTTLNPGAETGQGKVQGYEALYYLTAAGTQSGLYSYGAESAKVFKQMVDSIQSISTDGTITPTQMKWVAQQYGIDLDTVDTARATREASALLGKDLNDQKMEELRRAAQMNAEEPHAVPMPLQLRPPLWGGYSMGMEPFPGIGMHTSKAEDLANEQEAVRRARLFGAGMRMGESVIEIGGGIAATASGFQKLSSSRLALGSVAVVQGITDFDNATREWQNAWSRNPNVVESGYVEAYKDLAGTNAPPGWLYVADSVPRNLAMGQALIGIGGATGVTLSAGDVYAPGVYAGVGNALGAYTADRNISTADVMRSYDQGSTFGMLGGIAGTFEIPRVQPAVLPVVAAAADYMNQKTSGAANIDVRRLGVTAGMSWYGQSFSNYAGSLYSGPGKLPYLRGGFAGDALTVGPSLGLSSYGAAQDTRWLPGK